MKTLQNDPFRKQRDFKRWKLLITARVYKVMQQFQHLEFQIIIQGVLSKAALALNHKCNESGGPIPKENHGRFRYYSWDLKLNERV